MKRTGARGYLAALGIALLCWCGCRSSAPPPPVPEATRQSQFLAEQAAKLSADRNWSAAASEWQRAADQYSLLNDRTNLATAWHNLAQARRELGEISSASALLEKASALNRELGRTNDWWRNQIALLQIERQERQTNALAERFTELQPKLPTLTDPDVRGLFLNEIGIWQTQGRQFSEAAGSFTQAEQAFTQANDSDGKAAVWANRAQLFLDQTNYVSALPAWQQALNAYQALADPLGITRALEGQAMTWLGQKQNLPAAEDNLRRVTENCRILKLPRDQARALHALIRCLNAQGKSTEREQKELKAVELESRGKGEKG